MLIKQQKNHFKNMLFVLIWFVTLLILPHKITKAETLDITSGTCGENVTWEFNSETGVLTFSGTGDMEEYAIKTDTPFYNCTNISSVIIENGITRISPYLLAGCTGCSNVSIPDSVTSIGQYALWDIGITSLNIPEGVTSIEKGTCQACHSLTTVSLPSSLTTIGEYAFAYSGIPSLEIPNGVTTIGSYAFAYSSITSLEIPNGVTTINNNMCEWCEGLKTVILPNTVTKIDRYAFSDCRNLETISMPNSLTYIGNSAFMDCWTLSSINLPNELQHIEAAAFLQCQKLKSINIPDKVTSIEKMTFRWCSGLTEVHLGSGITTIGQQAFDNCGSLQSINFPEGLTTIKTEAFYCCKLDAIILPGSITSIEGFAFKTNYGLIKYLKIPATATGISPYAFREFFKTTYHYTTRNCSIDNYGNLGNFNLGEEIFASVNLDSNYIKVSDPSKPSESQTGGDIKSQQYTGSPIQPLVRVQPCDIQSEPALVLNKDYTLSYSNNINVGTATITITGKGWYCGSREVTFEITKGTISPSVSMGNFQYGETPTNPSITGNIGGGDVTYTYKAEGSSTFVEDKILTVGTHTVKATVGESDNYLGGSCTSTYTVTKADISPSVSMSNYSYGQTSPTPSVSGNPGNGEVIFMYKSSNAEEFTYVKPINAGSYTLKAIIGATANYNGGECTCDYTINKAAISPSISMGNFTFGENPTSPTVNGNTGNGSVVFTYKAAGSSTFEAVKPVNAGTHTVKATISATDNYKNATCTATYTVLKARLVLSVSIDNWACGESPSEPSFSGNMGGGTEIIEYKPADAENDEYSTEVPTEAGEYTIRYKVSETANYKSGSATNIFNITKTAISPSVVIDDWTYGEDAETPITGGNVGGGTETIEYKYKDSDDETYTTDVPTNAGNYTIRYTIAESDNYLGGVATHNFTINKANINPSMTMQGFTYGNTPTSPVIRGNKGNATVSYTYKAQGSSSYTSTKPVNVGTHTVKAVISESTNYNGKTITTNYTVTKANLTPNITMEDFVYGQTASVPSVTGNIENGTVTFMYKADGSDSFDTEKPVNAGTHTVKAIIGSTNNYNGATCTCTYTVLKADITASISMEDWTYGENASTPTTSCDIDDATEVIEYKLTSSDEWSTAVPTNAGDYTIRYIVSKDNYNTKTVTDTFKILKADINPEVTMADFTYSDTPSTPSVTGNAGNGNVTYTYKTEDSSSYATDVPVNVGTYMIKAVIAETDNYKGATVTNTFKILKVTKNITVSMDGFTYGQTATSPTVNGVGDHNGEVTYTYKAEGSDDFVTIKPVNAGTHTVKATVSETDNFKSVSATSTYTVAKADINPTVSLAGWVCGDPTNAPVVTGNSGNGEISYLYKLATANDSEYTATMPTSVGMYILKATIAETDNYNGGEATCDFEIKASVGIEKPSIAINSSCKAVITAGNISGDTVSKVEYRLNDGEWTAYTEPVTLYKAYKIEARQIAKESGKISDTVVITGEEPITNITATYTGADKYLNAAVEKSEITVVAHYPNSDDETITDFSIDNYIIKREGNNTITISALDKQTTVTVKGKKHYIDVSGTLLFADDTPVANKDICLVSESEETLGTTTDDNGVYTFNNVEVGNYRIIIKETTVTTEPVDLDTISKEKGDSVSDVDLRLNLSKNEFEEIENKDLLDAKEFLTNNAVVKKGTTCNLPKDTTIVMDGKPVAFNGGGFAFTDPGIYAITLPDGTSYTVIAIDEKEISDAKEILSTIGGPVVKGTEYDLPKGTKVTVGDKTIIVENGKYTFDKPGIYEITLPDGTKYTIIVVDAKEMSDAKDTLSELEKGAKIGDSVTLPEGSKVTLDGKEIDITDGNLSFKEPGTYVVYLPGGITYTIIIEKADATEKDTTTTNTTTIETIKEPQVVVEPTTAVELPKEEDTLRQAILKVKPKITRIKIKKASKCKLVFKGINKNLQKQGVKYQIQISKNKKFKKCKNYYCEKDKYTTKKLKDGKCYIRIRLVSKDKKIIGKWSKVRKIKVK